jgi:hypothetical protein
MKPYYLTDLPYTPNLSNAPHLLYEGDTDEVGLPNPVIPEAQNGVPTIRMIVTPKNDVRFLQREMLDKYHVLKWAPTSFREEKIADACVKRCWNMIDQRLDDPDLYTSLGIKDNHSSRQALTSLHMWMYLHAVQYRQIALTNDYVTAMFVHFDIIMGDRLTEKTKSRRRAVKVMTKHLPAVRAEFIVYDKAMRWFMAGDPEPLYGVLYRALYKHCEEDKITRRSKEEAKMGILPGHHVFMDNPVDVAYMNNAIQYIMNHQYFCATTTPRDYYLHIAGFSDFTPIPEPPKKLIGPVSRAEMMRYAYPICRPKPETTAVETSLAKIIPNILGFKKQAMVADTKSGPVLRPPSFMYTLAEQNKKN